MQFVNKLTYNDFYNFFKTKHITIKKLILSSKKPIYFLDKDSILFSIVTNENKTITFTVSDYSLISDCYCFDECWQTFLYEKFGEVYAIAQKEHFKNLTKNKIYIKRAQAYLAPTLIK